MLSREFDELTYEFDFNMESYAYLAIVMSKLDRNLLATHLRLIPDMVGEESFWRNYFYEIEKFKFELGNSQKIV